MPYNLLFLGQGTKSGAILEALRREFDVEQCGQSLQAFQTIGHRIPDLIILDSDLPDMNGMSFLGALRQTENGKQAPVIYLCDKKSEAALAQAFAFGVDDFLARPFDVRELRVRILAVLRRRHEQSKHWGNAISVGGIELDPDGRCKIEGKRVRLQPREFELLEILMRKAGRTLSRNYLLEAVWGMSSEADTRAVDVVVSRLRRRLGARGHYIETVPKMGYCFNDPAAL